MNVRTVALVVTAIAATMYLLHWARQAFIPIVLSILISYALEPVVKGLMRLRMRRLAASALVVTLVTGSLGYTIYGISDDVTAIARQLPEAAQKLRQVLRRDGGPGTIQQVQKAADELQRAADEAAGSTNVRRVQVETPVFDVRQYVTWGSASLAAFSAQATLVVFFVFFLLASGDLFKRKLVKLAGPSLERKRVTVQILDEINAQIARFLLVRVVTSILVGIATWIVFRLFGLEQAGVWGVAAGIFNSIPYFGPMIVAAGSALIAFLQFGTIAMTLYVSGTSLVITSVEGWLVTPWLTSRAARTNEVAVFVALIFWSFVWGIWGTLLAVPMLVAVKAYCDRIDDLKPVGELIGE
jgi:predicted PurR-regulated permease PerM